MCNSRQAIPRSPSFPHQNMFRLPAQFEACGTLGSATALMSWFRSPTHSEARSTFVCVGDRLPGGSAYPQSPEASEYHITRGGPTSRNVPPTPQYFEGKRYRSTISSSAPCTRVPPTCRFRGKRAPDMRSHCRCVDVVPLTGEISRQAIPRPRQRTLAELTSEKKRG
jgi:hypothetical protein